MYSVIYLCIKEHGIPEFYGDSAGSGSDNRRIGRTLWFLVKRNGTSTEHTKHFLFIANIYITVLHVLFLSWIRLVVNPSIVYM